MTAPDCLARFAGVVCEAPDRQAVRSGDEMLTFAQLDLRIARLAAVLRTQGIGPGDRVGISLPRGVDLVTAPLAAWRVGAAYVPLDPAYPADRLAFMAADAGIATLITAVYPDVQPRPAASDGVITDPDLPAYVIYTSGSTGTPKGVEITRGSVASLLTALEEAGVYTPAPRVVGWNASISFDASVKQLIRVCRGDTVVILADAHRTDPVRLRALLAETGVEDLDLTPTHWEIVREELCEPLAEGRVLRLLMGGEPIPEKTWREIADSDFLEGVNLYGPTECTVDATAARITGATPHLGASLPGNKVYILDRELCPATDGELYIAGPRLARGYLNRPALTAQRFVPDPFSGGRMYRTGDRARRTSDGLLTSAGRVDRQLKWRGFRVEPAEIEHCLGTHPDVAAAAVVLRAGSLIAYVVPRGRNLPGSEQLAEHVLGDLPEFMLPSKFVPLDALPLTANGKLDLAALAR
jgi:amino acid adenylation domain-containing protein